MDGSMICLGDKVRIVATGMCGKVVGRKQGVSGQHLYFVQLDDDQVSTKASDELEVIDD